jgi:mono/diheme cytochrome c family protein
MLLNKLLNAACNRRVTLAIVACTIAVLSGCRYDMQDQPRYKYYKQSEFFADKRASRDRVEGTVARGHLNLDKAFYTGKIDNPNPNAQVQTETNAAGNTIVSSFPNDITEFPMPITKELIDRGQERYNIYCIVCHGPVGRGDGMVVRRGFSAPPTYHDDRLRNAPVGHFYDVITNGWGKMNSYSHQVQPADRWAIVAYIRALQAGQTEPTAPNTPSTTRSETNSAPPAQGAAPNPNGGHR